MRYRWDPVYPASGRCTGQRASADLRASDAERNEVADKLSRHYADGRLDQAEFKARLDRALAATTRGDLDGLFDDLPRLVTEPPPPPSRRRRLVPFVVIVVLIAAATTSTASMAHLAWLPLVVIALFLWSRASRRHHTARAHGDQ